MLQLCRRMFSSLYLQFYIQPADNNINNFNKASEKNLNSEEIKTNAVFADMRSKRYQYGGNLPFSNGLHDVI